MAAMKKDFGAFELHEKIGSGGMASVYLGVQKSLDRKVVLKILYPHLAEDEKLVQRFEREARAAAMLRHPNIVQVIDCGRFEDVAYIAMEFVEGLDLKKWVEQFGTPPLEVALLLVSDICAGIEHAHQARIVHRDIKPANIMLTPGGIVKIMDFGLARKGEDSTQMTVAGSVLGTPAYMSPEQATGETVDERSDIFSAGVVAYELLGGTRPFQGDSYSTVLRAILTVEPPALGSFNPLVPEPVVKIVQKMLQKDVSKRYARMSLVRQDFENVFDELGLLRARDLLREYAQDPKGVTETLRKKRLSRHLDQGIYFETMGLGKIDDAMLEFHRVLHIDPENKTAREHLKKLEKEREKHPAVAAPSADAEATVVMPAGFQPAPAAGAAPAARPAAPAGAAATRAGAAAPASASRAAPRPAARPEPASGGSSTRGLMIGAGILVVAILAIGGYLLFGRGGGEPAEPSPTPPPPTQATAPATPETPPAPSTETTPPEATTPIAGQLAGLDLRTTPTGARVLLNGRAESKRTNYLREDLEPGAYTLRVERPGYLPHEQSLTLRAGERTQLDLALQVDPEAVGTVTLQVKPYASFFVDGQPMGQPNVVTQQFKLKPGQYSIRAVHPSFEAKVWSNVKVEPGATLNLAYDFTKGSVGSLSVSSGGVWAYVVLNGQNTGKTTPAQFPDLKPGTYRVMLQREGFAIEGGERTVTVREGGSVTVDFRLRLQ
jgi:serine/threonine-protein kinase